MDDSALPGLAHGAVQLADWTPRWGELFAVEAARLRSALGDLAVAIEHYGSTSVPGLLAKPLLDILVGGPDASDAAPYIAALAPLGYDYAANAGVPDHLVFGRGTARTHLVHVVRYGGRAWRRALAFRDALRENVALRDAPTRRSNANSHGSMAPSAVATLRARAPLSSACLALPGSRRPNKRMQLTAPQY